MNWVLTRHPRSRRARDKTFSLAPAWSFEIRSDAVTQPNLSEPATRSSIETIQALSAQVPDAGGELQPQKMKQGEDDLGVASGVRRVLDELVRDKAGGRSRSCAQIARNEAEVAQCTKLKREPQAVCCPPPDGNEVSVGTRQRECSDQVIARDFLGKAGQPSQLSL